MRVLAIDLGATYTKALVVDATGQILARACRPLSTAYPQPGWAEQSADEIWTSVQSVIADVVAQVGQVDALAIANQRETLVGGDSDNQAPICPAILW